MTPLSIQVPFPVFTDIDGQPLEAGYVWIGTVNLDPQVNPINVYWDAALTQPAGQPIRTLAGYPSNSGTPARLYVNSDYSIRVMDKNGSVVYSAPSATERYSDVVVSMNAKNVVYTSPFAGSVTTNVEAKLAQTVSVKDFGAVGNGVADDTAAIQLAVASLVDGGSLLFNPGTYKVTAPISQTFNNGAVISIVGYGAKIDGSSVTGSVAGDTTLITLGGARLAGVALGANAAKYATSITTASAITAAVNDIALITSTDLWNPNRPYYYKGEFVEMRSISGTTIGCHIALYDSYTAATTTVHPLQMPTVTVEGLEIDMNSNQLALVIQYCRNPAARNLKVHGSRYTGIALQYCFGGTVENNEVYDVWYGSTGTSYGVAISTCQNAVVAKNNLTEARHCIAGGGWEPCRNIIYSDNICTVHPSETIGAAIDHHGNMEYCQILNNIANGGIAIGSINSTIKGNTVSEWRNVGQAINIFQEISSDFYEISGNTVVATGTAYGFWHSPYEVSISVNRFIFHDNNIKSVGRAANFQPRNSTVTGCSISTLSVKNNLLESTGASQAAFYQGFTGAAAFTTTLFDSANNIYRSANHDVFAVQGTVPTAFSTNDKFFGNRNGGYLVQFRSVDTTLLNPYFEGNTGGAGNSRSVNYWGSGVVRCINPVFKNLTYKAELEAAGPSLYVEQGWYSATPTILNPAGARLINFFGTLGRAITYGTAAPTTGTWAVGDRVYSQSPAVGSPKSWVCTVAGTPGTWISEGDL